MSPGKHEQLPRFCNTQKATKRSDMRILSNKTKLHNDSTCIWEDGK